MGFNFTPPTDVEWPCVLDQTHQVVKKLALRGIEAQVSYPAYKSFGEAHGVRLLDIDGDAHVAFEVEIERRYWAHGNLSISRGDLIVAGISFLDWDDARQKRSRNPCSAAHMTGSKDQLLEWLDKVLRPPSEIQEEYRARLLLASFSVTASMGTLDK